MAGMTAGMAGQLPSRRSVALLPSVVRPVYPLTQDLSPLHGTICMSLGTKTRTTSQHSRSIIPEHRTTKDAAQGGVRGRERRERE